MKKLFVFLGLIVTVLLVMNLKENEDTDYDEKVAFPEGYRNWTHVKSVVVMKSHSLYERFGGMHHIYANDKALMGLKDTIEFEKGSIFVFDLKKEVVIDSLIYAGARRGVSVMVKDNVRFAETGGWGFEEFINDNQRIRTITNANQQCFSCHKTQKNSDYVFSKYRD